MIDARISLHMVRQQCINHIVTYGSPSLIDQAFQEKWIQQLHPFYIIGLICHNYSLICQASESGRSYNLRSILNLQPLQHCRSKLSLWNVLQEPFLDIYVICICYILTSSHWAFIRIECRNTVPHLLAAYWWVCRVWLHRLLGNLHAREAILASLLWTWRSGGACNIDSLRIDSEYYFQRSSTPVHICTLYSADVFFVHSVLWYSGLLLPSQS